MMKYMILMVLITVLCSAKTPVPCITQNLSFTVDMQKMQTELLITGKQTELKIAINKYKEALKKKKEMMTKLRKAVTKIEFVMKENQVLRKKMIKYWEDVKQSHSSMQSL